MWWKRYSRGRRHLALVVVLITFLSVAPVAVPPGVIPVDKELDAALEGLQQKYSRVRDLKMEFIQTYKRPRRTADTQTGTLILKQPRMMRWEYKTPTERLYVSKGKTVFFYLPQEKQVQKIKVTESRDQRIPFLLLLGNANLKREFSKVEWAQEKPFFQGNLVILTYPKQESDEFAKILLEFSSRTFQLQRVKVSEVDGTTNEFVFTNIQQDLGTAAGVFDFKAPPGTEVIERGEARSE